MDAQKQMYHTSYYGFQIFNVWKQTFKYISGLVKKNRLK